MRRLGSLLGVSLLVAACATSDGPADEVAVVSIAPSAESSSPVVSVDSTVPDEPVTTQAEETAASPTPLLPLVEIPARDDPDPFAPTGVATSFAQLSPFDGIDSSIPPADVRLTGCRLRQPGRITFDFEAVSATEGQATLGLSTAANEQADSVDGLLSVVELDGAGPFSVTTDVHRLPLWNGDLDDFVNGDFGDLDIYAGGFETSEIGGCFDVNTVPAPFVDLVDERVAPEVTAPEGTAEWYAQRAADPESELELLPLVFFVERVALVGFDRLHVAPGHRLQSMTVDYLPMGGFDASGTADPDLIGSCATVDSLYIPLGSDATVEDTIRISEWFGCAPSGSVRNVALGDPDVETVTVEGTTGVDALLADLVRAPYETA